MNTLLRITGIGKLISFYRYIYFNGPGVVKWSGIVLMLMIGLIHMYRLPEIFFDEEFVSLVFGAIFVGSFLSALWILKGLRWGWTLGSVISFVAIIVHFVSRIWGLPGWGEAVGEWDEPAGTVAMALELFFIFLHFSIITGMNVTAPNRRDWHD